MTISLRGYAPRCADGLPHIFRRSGVLKDPSAAMFGVLGLCASDRHIPVATIRHLV